MFLTCTVQFWTKVWNYEKKRDFERIILQKYNQHILKVWRDLTFIMNRIYPSMQWNEKCFSANQLHDAVKRLCNFAANWLHYAAKQLCSKVTRHQNCHTTTYISYACSNLILFTQVPWIEMKHVWIINVWDLAEILPN